MIPWTDIYQLGIPEIDDQHRCIFAMLSDIKSLMDKKGEVANYDDVLAAFDKLNDYTIWHFYYEEKIMRDSHYPEVEKRLHEWEHYDFIEHVGMIKKRDFDKNESTVLSNTIEFMKNWVEKHLVGADCKLGTFLKNKAADHQVSS